MFCKVLLNFWKDSEPEMSTITSSKTAIAAVARIYAKGTVDLLAFVFNILPLRPIVRILITAYLLTRTAWFLLGDAVPLPQTVLGSALVLAAALAIVECEVGDYLARALPLGNYALSVEQAGFKRYNRTGMPLTGGQVLRVDAVLEIGSATETVLVTAELPVVNVTTSTLDTMIDDKRLVDLPMN